MQRLSIALVTVGLVATTVAAALTGAVGEAAADGNEAPGAPEAFRSLTAGGGAACGILGDGSVKCWGLNEYGRLGLGDEVDRGGGPAQMGGSLPAIDLGSARTATAITAGHSHTCALLDDGTVRCWGDDFEGALGIEETGDRGDGPGEMGDALPVVDLGTGRTAAALTAGAFFTCAVLDDDHVKCWGFNQDGRLGLGLSGDSASPTRGIGDQPGDMGDALPPVDLGAGRTATAVTAGSAHACALLDGGAVKCWGDNVHGQLGQGHQRSIGDQPGEMGDALPAVRLGTGRTATAVSAGAQHTCALLDDGSVRCWGANDHGQLGQGDQSDRGDSTAPGHGMGDELPAVALGAGRTATAIAAGANHTCALLDDGHVRCWGDNTDGQLAQGDTVDRGDQPGELGDALPAVDLGADRTAIAVTAGSNTSCAVLDDLTLRCWGANAYGQLGLGDIQDRGDQPGEMGDALPPVQLTPVHALTASLAVDDPLVFTGDPVMFHVTISNTGNTTLTGLSVSDTAGFCLGPVNDLPPATSVVVDCTRTAVLADVGTIANTTFVDTAETEPVASNEAALTVAPDRQPDATIKKAGGTPVGGGVQGPDPAGPDQTVAVGRLRGGRVTVVARIENDGDASARYRLRRLGTDEGLSVRYFAGATDITRAVEARTYLTPPVAPGATTTVRAEITVGPRASRQVTHPVVLRALSAAPHPQLDTVRAVVQVF